MSSTSRNYSIFDMAKHGSVASMWSTALEEANNLLNEWYKACKTATTADEENAGFINIVKKLRDLGVLESGETMEQFMKVSINSVIQKLATLLNRQGSEHRSKSISRMDCLARLFSMIIMKSNSNNDEQRTKHLQQTLKVICDITVTDCKEFGASFNGYPHERLLLSLLTYQMQQFKDRPALIFNLSDSYAYVLCCYSLVSVTTTFRRAMTLLQPVCIPNFAASWLDILSDPIFIKLCLTNPVYLDHSRNNYAMLLAQCLKYLVTFVGDKMSSDTFPFCESVLRLFVRLYEYPEVLYQNASLLASFVPFRFVQLRNIILSATPSYIKLSNPFVVAETYEDVKELKDHPDISIDLKIKYPKKIDDKLRNFLRSRELRLESITQEFHDCKTGKYNVPPLCEFVLRLGMFGISYLQLNGYPVTYKNVEEDVFLKIFLFFCDDLSWEGRYIMFNAMANQLRYPNVHTHYFLSMLLAMYQKLDEWSKEVLVRVLLERVVACRPHPWGLTVIMVELVKNRKYQLWQQKFVHMSPDIEKAILSIARSCGVDLKARSEVGSERGAISDSMSQDDVKI
uniref:Not1 domain-containing protein n=1 Tax=Steinernema glaseri TaxID=37863 RepID=A0A1I8A4I2_9BILA